MTDEDCTTLRRHLASVRNREDTTSGLARVLGNKDNRHRSGTHIRHLEQNGELVPGRLERRKTNRELYIVPRRGRESWHHLLTPEEDRELGAEGLRDWLRDVQFFFETVPPRESRRTAVGKNGAKIPRDIEIPRARKGEESWGAYTRRLEAVHLEVMTQPDGTVRRRVIRIVRSDAGWTA